jgi:hypothetical protein
MRGARDPELIGLLLPRAAHKSIETTLILYGLHFALG